MAAKEDLAKLVLKYQAEAASDKLKKYSEEDVKKGFILPLFEVLGWDTKDRDEVSSEEHIKSSGRVDYGFYLNDRPKFYLEAKSAKANIHDEQWARQAIRYSWNKGVTWAVLTNFDHLLVFNAQDIKSSLHNKLLFDIPCKDFISRFEDVALLSKESFAANALDAYAERIGKKFQRVPISALLYKDLDECREILTRSLAEWNKEKLKGKPNLLDEGVQKLLDRLIFIRVAEDRGVEPPTLIPLVREWSARASKDKNETPLYASMVSKFRDLDKTYNSNLFSEHPFETWEEYSDSTAKAIKILYGKEGYYEYDFKAMPADVLGTVYENYLGHRLSQSKKGVTLDKDAGKRKEQGIYYTPSFVVDYIVEHALKPVLDKCKTMDQLLKVKVLDPACGSGSFLIKALEVLNEKYKELGQEGDETTKLLILTHNIYGVDLDEQAVEIARLNLCINSLDGKIKLPYLTDNIKQGNSLISGTDEELKKYFGPDFREKKPFNWKEEFPNIFARGGFDVVIGNPPWVSNDNIDQDEKEFFKTTYQIAESRFDLSNLFVERAISVLKRDGFLGFVMPEHLWIGEYFRPFRTYLEEKSSIMQILSSKEENFAQVANPSSIFLTKKTLSDPSIHRIILGSFSAGILKKYEATGSIVDRVVFDRFTQEIKKRIEKASMNSLGETAIVTDGIQTANLLKEIFTQQPENSTNYKKALRSGAAIKSRYAPIVWDGWWVLKPELTHKLKRPGFSYDSPKRMKCFNAAEKIILRQTEPTILATLDVDAYFFPNSIFQVALEKENPRMLGFLLGVTNSTFLRFYYSKLSQVEGTTKPQMYLNILKSLPMPDFNESIYNLVTRMLNLQKQTLETEENSNEWEHLRSEIQKTDKKIDEEVYKLYGLTDEDVRAIEGAR